MKFSGEGFSINSEAPENEGYTFNRATPSEKFELPTYLNIAAAYDFYLDGKHLAKADDQPKHRLSVMAAFTSNSFNNDYIAAGLEYSFQERFVLRGGYRYEKDVANDELSTTFYKGFSAGAGVMTKLSGSGGTRLGFDYSFRPTHRPDNGLHNFAVRFMLGKSAKPDAEE
jgi:hypothetical protein